MGETVRLDATISNKTQTGQPMTLARLGLPGGLTFQNWQLKELREKGQIAFYETRAREVILYFRDMKPGEVKKIAIDLVASVPGHVHRSRIVGLSLLQRHRQELGGAAAYQDHAVSCRRGIGHRLGPVHCTVAAEVGDRVAQREAAAA